MSIDLGEQKDGILFETDSKRVVLGPSFLAIASTEDLHTACIDLTIDGADAIARALTEWAAAKRIELDQKRDKEFAQAIAEVEFHEKRLGLAKSSVPLFCRLDRVIDTYLKRGEKREEFLAACEGATEQLTLLLATIAELRTENKKLRGDEIPF